MFWISMILIASIMTLGQCKYGSPCRTPDNLPGICVPVLSCKPVFHAFQQVKQRNGSFLEGDQQRILELHCGTFGNVHHICCVASDIQLNPQGLSVLQNQECGVYNVNRVTNGMLARLSGYPWMALLVYDDESDPYKCAGSLISEQYVLTAAHCIKAKESMLSKVRLGEHRKSTTIDCVKLGGQDFCAPPTVDVGIAETIIHPQYRGAYNDIALIRLESKVQVQSHIKPTCLPIYDDVRVKLHDQYVISGWGRTETGNLSDVLMVALLPRVEIASCESQLREYQFTYKLNVSHICAGGNNLVDTCKGDSGGPLGYSDMYDGRPRFVQYGVVAAGLRFCGRVNIPGIYTNVSYNIQWITDHIRSD